MVAFAARQGRQPESSGQRPRSMDRACSAAHILLWKYYFESLLAFADRFARSPQEPAS
jgi:hypothetical protein